MRTTRRGGAVDPRGAKEWHGETQREQANEDGFWDEASFEAQSLRSQTSSVINSRGFRQMLTAAAYMIEMRISEAAEMTEADVRGKGWDCLLDQNASGGGLKTDIINLMCAMMQGMEAEPQDMVEVIVYWYFLIIGEDLPLCSVTWRPLAVTSLLAAIKGTLPDQYSVFYNHLGRWCVHWFSTDKLNTALDQFIKRSQCARGSFSASVYAKVFFNLRDVALRCEDPSTSSLNAECASANDHCSYPNKDGITAWQQLRNRGTASDDILSVSCSSSIHDHDDSSDQSMSSLRRRGQYGGNRIGAHRQEPNPPAAAPTSNCKLSL